MSLNSIQNFAPASAYLSSRLGASKSNSEASNNASQTGFAKALDAAVVSPAQPAAIMEAESIPFASFIDNIDFTKFKSDPLHFGRFIPIEAESESSVPEALNNSEVVEATNTVAPLDRLLESIEAQLNYITPQAINTDVAPTEVALEQEETTHVESPLPPVAEIEFEAPHVDETLAIATQYANGLASKFLASTFTTQTSNPGDLLSEVLSEEQETNAST